MLLREAAMEAFAKSRRPGEQGALRTAVIIPAAVALMPQLDFLVPTLCPAAVESHVQHSPKPKNAMVMVPG
jgi:hypothetical protein